MSSGRFDSFRFFVCSFAVATATGALAQPTISFQALDVDGSGSLTRREFAELPGLRASQELFADLDANRDHTLSRPEWEAGSPDAQGMPQGSRWVGVGGLPARPRAQSFHGPNVPREPEADRSMSALSAAELNELKTGHAGASGTKRGLTAVPRTPPPALPPLSAPQAQ